jgi:hypothetical protein
VATQPIIPGQSYGPPRARVPYKGGTNLERDVWSNIRDRSAAGADEFDQQLRDQVDQSLEFEEYYRRKGEELFGPLAEGQGGYTPEQTDAIIREAELEGLQLTDSEKRLWHLQPHERQQILGNPEAAMDFFQPAAERLRGAGDDQAARLREGVGEFKGYSDDAIARAEEEFGVAIDRDRLRSDPGYAAEVDNMLSRVQGAVGDEDLQISDEYLAGRGYGDEDVQQIKSAAGRRAMANYEDAVQDMEARALAQGMNPLAVADMRKQLEREGAIASADAITDAELRGEEAQRGALQEIEETKLGAAGRRGELSISAGGLERGALGDVEHTRMAGEQFLTDAELDRAESLADLRYGRARDLGEFRTGTETTIGQTGVGTERFITDVGTGVAERGEATRTGRQTDIAKNRQETDIGLSGERYRRGLDINQLLSGRELEVAKENQAQAKQGRDYFAGQQPYYGKRAATGMGQRLQATEIGQQGELGAAGGLEETKRRKAKGFFGSEGGLSRITESGLRGGASKVVEHFAEGGIVTEPTLAIIGEAGPEAVVPLKRGPGKAELPPSTTGRKKRRQPYSTLPYAGRAPGYGPGDGRMEHRALSPSWR